VAVNIAALRQEGCLHFAHAALQDDHPASVCTPRQASVKPAGSRPVAPCKRQNAKGSRDRFGECNFRQGQRPAFQYCAARLDACTVLRMDVVVKLLRHRGTLIDRATLESKQWTACLLDMDGGRLMIRSLMSAPGVGVMAELYHPSVVRMVNGDMVLRGIEQVTDGDRTMAVMQEWRLSTRPASDGSGARHPLYGHIVERLPRPENRP
jgi:hypothetical protein